RSPMPARWPSGSGPSIASSRSRPATPPRCSRGWASCSTSPSQILPSCRPSISRGTSGSGSRSRSAVTAATSCSAAIPPSPPLSPMRWLTRLPAGLISAAGRGVEVLPGSTRYGTPSFLLKQFFRGAVHPFDVAAQIMMNGLRPDEQASLVGSAVRAANVGGNPYDDVVSTMTWAPTDDPISRLVYHHCKLYLAGQTLVKMDRATIAHGVEARAPFLDPALVALACGMPSSVKVGGLTTKAVLKRARKGRLPDQILTRRKQGFGVPIAQWFRGPLRPLLEATLAPARLRTVGLLDPDGVSRLVTEHVTARQNHGKALWSLVTLELWRQ